MVSDHASVGGGASGGVEGAEPLEALDFVLFWFFFFFLYFDATRGLNQAMILANFWNWCKK